ncbi:hypothetical protein F2Q68_00018821 [Brassica cretica]|uniref:Uncharacterized protein n=1 Tax=Brassica cretica TaxID=69181 RepID=A0A8S9FNX7_BRACR|nr:hypothetical protein F2Q68_00018821 [Brassica cretica]
MVSLRKSETPEIGAKTELQDNNSRHRAACSSSFRLRLRFFKATLPCDDNNDVEEETLGPDGPPLHIGVLVVLQSLQHLTVSFSPSISLVKFRRATLTALQTGVPGIRHSTFESLRVGRSSQSIASNLLAYEIPGTSRKTVNSVIHGFISAGRANHYMPSLKAGSIVKVGRFVVASRRDWCELGLTGKPSATSSDGGEASPCKRNPKGETFRSRLSDSQSLKSVWDSERIVEAKVIQRNIRGHNSDCDHADCTGYGSSCGNLSLDSVCKFPGLSMVTSMDPSVGELQIQDNDQDRFFGW